MKTYCQNVKGIRHPERVSINDTLITMILKHKIEAKGIIYIYIFNALPVGV